MMPAGGAYFTAAFVEPGNKKFAIFPPIYGVLCSVLVFSFRIRIMSRFYAFLTFATS